MLKNLIILFVFSLSSGCASISTTGSLPEVTHIKEIESTSTLQYRARSTTSTYRSTTIHPAPKITKMLTQQFEKWKFTSTSEYNPEIKHTNFEGENSEQKAQEFTFPKFPITSDYLLDLEAVYPLQTDIHGEGIMMWGAIHLVSLGFIPLTIANGYTVKITLYNKTGKIIQQSSTSDSGRIWSWTPLIFFNGFRFFESREDLERPLKKKVIETSLNKVQFN